MRKIALLAFVLLLLSSCATYHSAQVTIVFLKCGGMGGEQQFSRCSWRKTSIFAVMKRQKPAPQPKPKEAIRPNNRSSCSRSSQRYSYP